MGSPTSSTGWTGLSGCRDHRQWRLFIYSYILRDHWRRGLTRVLQPRAPHLGGTPVQELRRFPAAQLAPGKLFARGDAGGRLLVGLLMATSAISVTSQVDLAALQYSNSSFPRDSIPVLLPLAILLISAARLRACRGCRLARSQITFSADRNALHRLLDMGHSGCPRCADLLLLDRRGVGRMPPCSCSSTPSGRGVHHRRRTRDLRSASPSLHSSPARQGPSRGVSPCGWQPRTM
jgi:hypothetical protein